ncbi:MAG: hypothetical protein QG585_210 [Patescibacteria group bacterium]|nr:hypothetical protein [Patescibacteria group bacterium]
MKTVLLFRTRPYVGVAHMPNPSIAVITRQPEELKAALRAVGRVGKEEAIHQSILEAIKNIPETEIVAVEYC